MLLAQKAYAEGGLALGLYCARLVDEEETGPPTRTGGRAAPAARRAHPDRQELAVAVVPGRQRPRHPGARRLRLHPRLPGRAVLPRQPAQPDPRGHPRHPGARPARPQGRDARRRRAGAAGRGPCGRTAARAAATTRSSPPALDAALDRGRGDHGDAARRPATRPSRWPTRASTSRRSGTSSWRGCGWSSCSPRPLRRPGGRGAGRRRFYDGKRAAARYFFRFELPRTGPQFDLLDSLDTTTLDWSVIARRIPSPAPGARRGPGRAAGPRGRVGPRDPRSG